MPAIADAAAQARLFARRGADAAAVVLGASFHPFRTVREGAHLVQGLMNPREQVTPTPPATDASVERSTEPAAKKATAEPTKKTAKKATKKAPKKPATKPAPGPTTVAKEPAPPAPDPQVPEAADVPVDPSGPLPHIPPRIAGEVERDYGDELPGIKDWEG